MSVVQLSSGFVVNAVSLAESIEFMQNDLAKSGLVPADMFCNAEPPGPHTQGEYTIPYFTRDGTKLENMWSRRVKRESYIDNEGKTLGKYYQASAKLVGALAVLPYMNPNRLPLTGPLHIHEGAKKSAIAIKCGRRAIAISGAHNWHAFGSKTHVHPDILAECKGREVILWPDGDILTNPGVSQGWGSLAHSLTLHGISVRCMSLISADKKYDDLIVEYGGGTAAADRIESEATTIDITRLQIGHATLCELVPNLDVAVLTAPDGSPTGKRIIPNERNIRHIFNEYGPLRGRFWYDVETQELMDRHRYFNEQVASAEMVDYFQHNLGFNGRYTAVSRQLIDSVLLSVIAANERAPFRDWLKSLTWDGTERLSYWLRDYCGGEDTDFAKLVARRLLIASCARICNPGCDLRWMFIMTGPQGCGKSGLPRAIWSDTVVKIMNTADTEKDEMMAFASVLVANYDELSALGTKRGQAHLKSKISTPADRFRPPYAKTMKTNLRRCVLVGSTNEEQYIPRDVTGNTRFVTVRVGANGLFDWAGIAAVREQLWAEAMVAYAGGERYNSLEDVSCEAEVSQFIEATPLEDLIRNRLAEAEELHGLSTLEVKKGTRLGAVDFVLNPVKLALALNMDATSTYEVRRVRDAIRALGAQYKQVRYGSRQAWECVFLAETWVAAGWRAKPDLRAIGVAASDV